MPACSSNLLKTVPSPLYTAQLCSVAPQIYWIMERNETSSQQKVVEEHDDTGAIPDDLQDSNHSYKQLSKYRRPHILMISDFFFPGLGGVENHILQLSQCLIARGLKVVIMTHQRSDRQGVRYMTGGLKVYYLPYPAPIDVVTFPTYYCFMPLLREIIIRESIDIVHGHQVLNE